MSPELLKQLGNGKRRKVHFWRFGFSYSPWGSGSHTRSLDSKGRLLDILPKEGYLKVEMLREGIS